MNRLRHPIRAIREPFGTAGLIVACIALIAALSGTALAAKGALTGKQKKEVEKIAKKFAGKPGAPGPTGPAGAAGKDGANGTNGLNGTDGAPGAPGQNGTTGFTKTLPSGETETGVWTLEQPKVEPPAENPVPYTSISYSIPLGAEFDEEHVIFLGEGKEGTEHESECPGSSEEPLAAKGYLCVYTTHEQNVTSAFLQPPGSLSTKGAGTNGALIRLNPTSEDEPLIGLGSWAVTAP